MSKKLILALVAVVFLFKFGLAEAGVSFNEIAWKGMTTGSTHEWIELFNTGAGAENISGWIIKDGVDQLNILIPLGTTIPAGGFYVIKRSASTVTPSNLSISFNGGLIDSGEKLILVDDSGTQKEVLDFSDGWPDPVMTSGDTMQWNGSSWITAEPTPGKANQTIPNSNSEEENVSSDEEEEISEPEKKVTQKLQKSKVQIISPKIAHVGVPFQMEGSGTGTLGEKLTRGVFYWNFDDGDFREVKAVIKDKFTHTYFYPGEYNVTLLYYPDVFTDTPDATTEITIKVLEPKILISRVGEVNDFFIEIANETGHEANLSNWVLLSDYKIFTLPKNTTLSSNKKMIISPKVSHFSIEDKSSLKLMTPEREVVFEYVSSAVPQAKVAVKKSSSVATKEEKSSVSARDLTATTILGQPKKDSDLASPSSSFVFIIFLLFMGASAGGVYFIRRRRNMSPTPADDFEILDE